MKLKENFITHDIDGSHFLLCVEDPAAILQLNHTAAFIVECLKEDQTRQTLLKRVMEKYRIEKEMAEPAISRLLDQLQSKHALEGF